MTVQVKICGLGEPMAIEAAIEGGAHYLGFVFYPPSPRFVSFDLAGRLAAAIPADIKKVGVFVDPGNDAIESAMRAGMDIVQLHGTESPGRVADIRTRFKQPVIKALRIADAPDLAQSAAYETIADFLMFDTKSSKSAGGTGEVFDWAILRDRKFSKPWFLSGGLTMDNVKAAIEMTHASLIDISSGVEDAPGRKNPEKIKNFLAGTMGKS